MTPDPGYTPDPADVELVARALWSECGEPGPVTPTCREDARAVLSALAAAGRLRDAAADVVTPAGWTRRCGPTCTGHPEETP